MQIFILRAKEFGGKPSPQKLPKKTYFLLFWFVHFFKTHFYHSSNFLFSREILNIFTNSFYTEVLEQNLVKPDAIKRLFPVVAMSLVKCHELLLGDLKPLVTTFLHFPIAKFAIFEVDEWNKNEAKLYSIMKQWLPAFTMYKR